jgi:hypothetical protein
MRKSITICAITGMCSMAALLPATTTAVAQAGSTGGTIGKTDKSVSGTEAEDQRHAPRRKNAAGAGCRLGATWSNVFSGGGTSVWTISSDGTAVEQGMGNARGRATLSGHKLVISYQWSLGQGTYVMTLNQDCSAGSGRATATGGWDAGKVWSATFTAIPGSAN